jgi:AcrR family transcriptional regulator
MTKARPTRGQESTTRASLLDATERILLESGYGAVSARRIAKEAGVPLGLVHYYFGPMENLLVEVFRRRADWMLAREAEALASDQPLWALWDITRETANTPLNTEFLALGNHYAKLHDDVCAYSTRFRRLQHELVSKSLADRGSDTTAWPPAGVLVLIDGMSRFLGSETMYDMSFGHRDATMIIERLITELEGPRKRRRRRPQTGR